MAKVTDIFYERVLQAIGVLPTSDNVNILKYWQTFEGGNAKNNPLNTTYNLTGATDYNTAKVKNYATAEDGIKATAKTLLLNYYKPIVKALKENKSFEYWRNNQDIDKSLRTWGTVNFANYLNKPITNNIPTPAKETPDKKKKIILISALALTLILLAYANKPKLIRYFDR
jgi:hypothetical protein